MAVELTVVVNVELRRDVRDAAELGGGEGGEEREGEGRGAVLTMHTLNSVHVCMCVLC